MSERAEQGSFEWFKQRWGKVTMSSAVVTLLRGTIPERNKLLQKLRWQHENHDDDTIAEYWEKEARAGNASEAMSWGKKHEDEALRHYAMTRNVDVVRPEFQPHPEFPTLAGTSADFLQEESTVGEIKCPLFQKRHAKYVQYGMPDEYGYPDQIQGHMECWRRDRGIWASYDPRCGNDDHKLYVQVVQPDEAWRQLFRERMKELADLMETGKQWEFPHTEGLPKLF